MTAADTAIQYAIAQVGDPYKWGATGPNAFDCSGLVYSAYKHAGINLPRTTAFQISAGVPVTKANLQPGDLVFPDPGHVQIYLGNNKIVEAPHSGANVRVVTMWGFWRARRVTAPGTVVGGATGDPGASVEPGGLTDSAKGVLDALGSFVGAAAWLSEPHNWLRVAMLMAGAILIYAALISSTRIKSVAGSAQSAVKGITNAA